VTPSSFRSLIGELSEKSKINIVLGKALRVLPETEILKPVTDLLHRGAFQSQIFAPRELSERSSLELSLSEAVKEDRVGSFPSTRRPLSLFRIV
jgi:hypothetical protein